MGWFLLMVGVIAVIIIIAKNYNSPEAKEQRKKEKDRMDAYWDEQFAKRARRLDSGFVRLSPCEVCSEKDTSSCEWVRAGQPGNKTDYAFENKC